MNVVTKWRRVCSPSVTMSMPGVLLVEQREPDRVALALRERLAFELPRRPQLVRLGEPGGLGQAAGDGGLQVGVMAGGLYRVDKRCESVRPLDHSGASPVPLRAPPVPAVTLPARPHAPDPLRRQRLRRPRPRARAVRAGRHRDRGRAMQDRGRRHRARPRLPRRSCCSTRRSPPRCVAALPELGIVSRIGAGYDTVDTEACERARRVGRQFARLRRRRSGHACAGARAGLDPQHRRLSSRHRRRDLALPVVGRRSRGRPT